MRIAVAALMFAALAACGNQEKQQTPDAPAATGPAMPAWAGELVGRSISETFPTGGGPCQGYVDSAEVGSANTTIKGWSWDATNRRPYDAIISVGADTIINGAGTTTSDRPDVVEAMNGVVTTPRVGYDVISTATSGTVRVYGVDLTAHTACSLGLITF